MQIPFTIEEFLYIFELYNQALWPMQLFLYLLAVIVIVSLIRGKEPGVIIFSILGFLWIWMGVVYHILYFSSINPLAYVFGSIFIFQGILFLYFGALKRQIQLVFTLDAYGIIALIVILYALIIYPVVGYYNGHVYPRLPTFGVPCPTTIFTFGVLLFSTAKMRWYVILIPFLWSLVGFSAAVNLKVVEDYGLVIAGLITTVILLFMKPGERKLNKAQS